MAAQRTKIPYVLNRQPAYDLDTHSKGKSVVHLPHVSILGPSSSVQFSCLILCAMSFLSSPPYIFLFLSPEVIFPQMIGYSSKL